LKGSDFVNEQERVELLAVKRHNDALWAAAFEGNLKKIAFGEAEAAT
jgi:hypothetical protein